MTPKAIPSISCIYAIVCSITETQYIGSTKNLRDRFTDHRRKLRLKNHQNIHLQRAFNKYGELNFRMEILEELPEVELIQREQHYLDQTINVYNLVRTAGKPPIRTHQTPETCRKISVAHKGRPSQLRGRAQSVEHTTKVAIANRGKKRSKEFREYLRQDRTGKILGRRTEEERKYMRLILQRPVRDSVGKRFGMLVCYQQDVTHDIEGRRTIEYWCICDCGNKKSFKTRRNSIAARSCGCLRRAAMLNAQRIRSAMQRAEC